MKRENSPARPPAPDGLTRRDFLLVAGTSVLTASPETVATALSEAPGVALPPRVLQPLDANAGQFLPLTGKASLETDAAALLTRLASSEAYVLVSLPRVFPGEPGETAREVERAGRASLAVNALHGVRRAAVVGWAPVEQGFQGLEFIYRQAERLGPDAWLCQVPPDSMDSVAGILDVLARIGPRLVYVRCSGREEALVDLARSFRDLFLVCTWPTGAAQGGVLRLRNALRSQGGPSNLFIELSGVPLPLLRRLADELGEEHLLWASGGTLRPARDRLEEAGLAPAVWDRLLVDNLAQLLGVSMPPAVVPVLPIHLTRLKEVRLMLPAPGVLFDPA